MLKSNVYVIIIFVLETGVLIMLLWQIYSIAGVVCIILEMLIPSMFFLNLAIAGFITAIISLFIHDANMLAIDFIILSIVSVFVIVLLTMMYSTSKIKKHNIIEQIREENI